MSTIGERLRIARDKSGLKQTQVKERTNINNKTLSGYENNVSQPDPETLVVLADLYEVKYEWLFAGKGEMLDSQVSKIKIDGNSTYPKLTTNYEQNIWNRFKKYVTRKDELSDKANKYQLIATEREELNKLIAFFEDDSDSFDVEEMIELDELRKINDQKANSIGSNLAKFINKVIVAGQEITLTLEELMIFEELKKHPIMFNDLETNPEAKVKELIQLYKVNKAFLEEDTEELGEGFGELED